MEDKPIDQMPAEEVADEEIEESNENRGNAEEGASSRYPQRRRYKKTLKTTKIQTIKTANQ